MDIQKMLDNAMGASRLKTLASSPQLTLNELILSIEPFAKREEETKEEATIYFDFEYLKPTGIGSWRGSYAELALSFDGENEFTASKFLKLLKSCLGKTFQGYKGGDYVMGKNTPIWVANYGNSGNTGIVGVLDKDYKIILQTAYCEF